MIDKLTLAIPAAQLRQDFYTNELIPVMKAQRTLSPSKTYRNKFDLRPLEIPALFHYAAHFGAGHKVEFIGVGQMPYSDINAALARIVDDPGTLRIMRVDLAADVPDVPVAWFREHTWVSAKQVSEQYGKVHHKRRRSEIETLYFGAKPDRIIIYDKGAKQCQEYQALRKRIGSKAPSFEDRFGHPERGFVLTRVERQYSRRSVIPAEISSFGQLHNAIHCRPFVAVHFEPMARSLPEREPKERLGAYALRVLLNDINARDGFQAMRAWVNKNSGGNAARYLRKCLRPEPEATEHVPDLQAIFLESTRRQLAG